VKQKTTQHINKQLTWLATVVPMVTIYWIQIYDKCAKRPYQTCGNIPRGFTQLMGEISGTL